MRNYTYGRSTLQRFNSSFDDSLIKNRLKAIDPFDVDFWVESGTEGGFLIPSSEDSRLVPFSAVKKDNFKLWPDSFKIEDVLDFDLRYAFRVDDKETLLGSGLFSIGASVSIGQNSIGSRFLDIRIAPYDLKNKRFSERSFILGRDAREAIDAEIDLRIIVRKKSFRLAELKSEFSYYLGIAPEEVALCVAIVVKQNSGSLLINKRSELWIKKEPA